MSTHLGNVDSNNGTIDEEQLNEFMLAIDNLESSNLIFEELEDNNKVLQTQSTVKSDDQSIQFDVSMNTITTPTKPITPKNILQNLIPLSLSKSTPFTTQHDIPKPNYEKKPTTELSKEVPLQTPKNGELSATKIEQAPATDKSVDDKKTTTSDLKHSHSHSDKMDVNKNGWTLRNQSHFQICLHRLKYYRVINNFFFFELKKREGRLSWAIIVLSSFSSVLSLIESDKTLFPYSTIVLKWILVLFTLLTTLIGSFIKKQQFIDKINIIDRYLLQLNQTIEDLNITAIIEPDKRDSYDDFCKKYIPILKSLSVSPASFSPKEWKSIVYRITKYYPELTYVDGSEQERLWPWYYMNSSRKDSGFGKMVIESYKYLNKNTLFSPDYINEV